MIGKKIITITSFIINLFSISFLLSHQDRPIFYKESPFIKEICIEHDTGLVNAVDDLNDFFGKLRPRTKFKNVGTVFSSLKITWEQVRKTIEFVDKVMHTTPEKMSDVQFLQEHFDFYRWRVNSNHTRERHGHYGPPDYIFTTSYFTPHCVGSTYKTDIYTVPVYSVPHDEHGLTSDEALALKHNLLRFKYSYHEIVNGALENNSLVRVLGWLEPKSYRQLMLQGSMVIEFNNKTKKLCEVAKKNGKPHGHVYCFCHIKDEKKIPSKKSKFPRKPEPIPHVTLAGNLEGLGFGKLLLMLSHQKGTKALKGRFGLLTDTGSAFVGNYHQVDMYAGQFLSEDEFKQHVRKTSHTARMYVMIKK